METKICTKCKKEFPKTLEYFFRRITKQKLANGNIAEYETFRSCCKKCHGNKGEECRIKKRCEEMGCEIDDYRENWKKQYSETRTKHPEIKHLSESVKKTLRKWIDNGYNFTTYKQYRIDCRKKLSKLRRKYDYGSCDFVPQKEKNRRGIKNLTDGYIALIMNMSVKELTPELIETQRLVIKLKRELGLTRSIIKSRNINNKYKEQWKQKEI